MPPDPPVPATGGGASQPSSQVGHYTLVAELARGGQGIVYRARHTQLGNRVAVKLLKAFTQQHLQRFRLEAQVLVRLQHPNLPRVLDLGLAGSQPYLVMDLLEGPDLSAVLRERGPFSFADAASVLTPIAEALQHAHERGVIHRDVKPKNVVLHGPQQVPMLIDFGLLKRDPDSDLLSHEERVTRLTQSGETLGTPAYMPPEQIDPSFGEQSIRSDVYGLGATLYFLLTGHPPFTGATHYNVFLKVMRDPPPDPRAVRSDVPAHLAELCLRAMSKVQEERPNSAQAFAKALRPPRGGGLGWVLPLACGLGVLLVALLAVVGWALHAAPPTPTPTPLPPATDPAPAPPPPEPLPPPQPEANPTDALPWLRRPIAQPFLDQATTSLARQVTYAPGWGVIGFPGKNEQSPWRYDGGSWARLDSGASTGLPFRYGHAAAWDVRRETLVVFGGTHNSGRRLADVLEWKSGWKHIPAAERGWPAARRHHGAAYDRHRGVTVVFGGSTADGLPDDVWEWSGERWTNPKPAEGPSGRGMPALCSDPISGHVFMFGGQLDGNPLDDLWEWDGERWSLHQAPAETARPSGRWGAALAHSSDGHLLLYGGRVPNDDPDAKSKERVLRDTWSWSDGRWTQRRIPDGPAGSTGMVYEERRRTWVLTAGLATWERSTTKEVAPEPAKIGWIQRAPTESPSPREGLEYAMVHDGRRVLLFGGWNPKSRRYYDDLWSWDGEAWQRIEVEGAGPAGRFAHGVTWDQRREELVVVGGETRDVRDGRWVWSYRDGAWSKTEQPSLNRVWCASAYDSKRGMIYVYGGALPHSRPAKPYTDLWRRTPSGKWEQVAVDCPMGPRKNPALGYDPGRDVLVLCGGRAAEKAHDDVWEWKEGQGWTQRRVEGNVGPRRSSAWRFFYDGARLVLFGGRTRLQTWAWLGESGGGWRIDRRALPPFRNFQGVVYDPKRNLAVLFGGKRNKESTDETWECSFPW